MLVNNPTLRKPSDENQKIWRYMDFAKFVSMLQMSSLFFARADKLGDPFEGSYPKANISSRIETYKLAKNDEELPLVGEYYKKFVKFTFINCWHLGNYESAAMWKLYLKSNEGIAIQSTFKRLVDALKNTPHVIFIGEVNYLDYQRRKITWENSLTPFTHKRISFQHECELRAFIQPIPIIKRGPYKGSVSFMAKTLDENGVQIKVDLDVLIERIYVAPTSPIWLFELVKSIVKQYKLKKEVMRSSLDEKPVY